MRAPAQLVILVLGGQALAAPGPDTGLQALRTPVAIRVDGHLDEAIWRQAPAASGFTQE